MQYCITLMGVALYVLDRRTMKGTPEELHGDDIMTTPHGATTNWMQANGETLDSIEEGDTVHVIDESHGATDTTTEYTVTDVPDMTYSFDNPAITITNANDRVTMGITIAVGKVSTAAQR